MCRNGFAITGKKFAKRKSVFCSCFVILWCNYCLPSQFVFIVVIRPLDYMLCSLKYMFSVVNITFDLYIFTYLRRIFEVEELCNVFKE